MASADAPSSESVPFSENYGSLTGSAKARYRVKVLICGFDPYMLKKSEYSEDLVDYPSMEYPDIVNYLVLQTSWITGQQMKRISHVWDLEQSLMENGFALHVHHEIDVQKFEIAGTKKCCC